MGEYRDSILPPELYMNGGDAGASSSRTARAMASFMNGPAIGIGLQHFDRVLTSNKVGKGTEKADAYKLTSSMGKQAGGKSPAPPGKGVSGGDTKEMLEMLMALMRNAE